MSISTLPNGQIIVPRADWGARHSPGRKPMAKAATKVFIHHTTIDPVGGAKGYDGVLTPSDDPCRDMRRLEDVLEARGLAPGYSYVAHTSGVLLEGAGKMVGAHTGGHNSEGYGFAVMGNFDTHQPTLAQLLAIARGINLLRLDGSLVSDLSKIEILGHRDTKATACPGANMYPLLGWIRLFAMGGN